MANEKHGRWVLLDSITIALLIYTYEPICRTLGNGLLIYPIPPAF